MLLRSVRPTWPDRDRRQCLRVFDSDREPDNVVAGAGRFPFLGSELAMRRRSRVDDQAARIADVGEMAEQFDVVDELHAGFVAALQSEGENAARAFRAVGAMKTVAVVVFEAGVI